MKKEYEEISKQEEQQQQKNQMNLLHHQHNIKINPEYSKLVNPLSKLEYEVLKKFNKQ